MTIFAERTETAIPISTTLTKFGLVTGATITGAIYDSATGDWLLNWATGTWQAAKATQILTENAESGGRYGSTANMSGADAGSTHFDVFFEVTAGGDGADQDTLILVGELYAAASQGSVNTVDANVDLVLADTAAMQPQVATGVTAWITATGFSAHTAADVWDIDNTLHLVADSVGFNQDAAASGGAGLTEQQVRDAVWDVDQDAHELVGSMGEAMADSGNIPAGISGALNRLILSVRKYGPIAVQQPLSVKDEVHDGDVGIIVTIPVILDGAFTDLADATSIIFNFQAPGSDNNIPKSGLGVTTPTGSYTTVTTDSDVFNAPGRWQVEVTVTWPDVTTKISDKYQVDVQPPLPLI
jgi:hypothetical protein